MFVAVATNSFVSEAQAEVTFEVVENCLFDLQLQGVAPLDQFGSRRISGNWTCRGIVPLL